MGLETRNESSERPEQIEKAQEQDTIRSKRMELNDSDFDDVDKKANKSDLSEVSREKKDTFASEKEEDFSDVKENGQKDKVQEYPDVSQEKHRIAAEDFAEPSNKEDSIMVDEPVGDDKSETVCQDKSHNPESEEAITSNNDDGISESQEKSALNDNSARIEVSSEETDFPNAKDNKEPSAEVKDADGVDETASPSVEQANESVQAETVAPILSKTPETHNHDNWERKPSEELYQEKKEVFDNPKYFDQETGEIHYPPNEGFKGEPKLVTLPESYQIDRYGRETGYFVAPAGTPFEQRSLDPYASQTEYHRYEVLKPIEGVKSGEIAPWFDEPGGGKQHILNDSIEDLCDKGYLKRI